MADGYLEIMSNAGYIKTPDSDVGSLGGTGVTDFSILIDLEMPDWDLPSGTYSSDVGLVGKQNEFLLQAKYGGANGAWRTQGWDASAQVLDNSQSSGTTFNVLSGRNFVRVDVDATNGSVHTCTYQYKTDTSGDLTTLTGWTTSEAKTGTLWTTDLRDTANDLLVGSHVFKGGIGGVKIYRMVIYRDLTGTDEWFDLDLRSGDWSDLGTGHNDGANTWTAVGAVTTDWQYVAATDTTAPVITITQPSASDVVGGTVEVRATFSDAVTAAANAANMEVSINSGAGAAMTWDAGGYWKYSWDTTGVADGATTIDVSGDDEAANTGNASQVSVTVDNTAPTIAITLPAGAATVSGTQEVRATFTDTNTTAANAASMEVSINGGAGAAMIWDASGWWDYQWDTTGTAEGAATIDVSGDDVVDLGTANTGNASQVAVTVDNVPDASPGTKKFKQLPQYGSIMFNGA